MDSLEQRKTALKGNAVLLMPLSAVPKYNYYLLDDEREALNALIEELSSQYFFLGELTFENKERFVKEHGKVAEILNQFIQNHGRFEIGTVENYNDHRDVTNIKNSPVSAHGTARRDKARDFLEKTFGDNKQQETLEIATTGAIEGWTNQFSISFKLSNKFQQAVQKENLTENEISTAINGSIKRVFRRAYLQKMKSSIPTDSPEAIAFCDSNNASIIKIENRAITLNAPLEDLIKGAFKRGVLTSEDVQDNLAKELVYGLRLAIAMKQQGPHLRNDA